MKHHLGFMIKYYITNKVLPFLVLNNKQNQVFNYTRSQIY